MIDTPPSSNWVEIDLQAIENNVRYVSEHCGAAVMAVVKADGYGHGAIPVARAALRGGAAWLAVARHEEALELRRAGLEAPILLLGYISPGQIETAVLENLSLTVWRPDQLGPVTAAAQRARQVAKVHLKVDTGMGRIGIQTADALDLARQLASTPGIEYEGMFTHFARADEADPQTTDQQEKRFQELLGCLEQAGLRPRWVHAANSAASLTRRQEAYDLARLGIAMYGLQPSPECPLPPAMRPALAWKSVLSHVKSVPPGEGISYGHEYFTQDTERIGTVPVGYADGFRRVAGNLALVGGQRVPVVGRVCMDQLMLQLDGVPGADSGDEVMLIGHQGEEQISAEEVAQRWHTINYEVVCGIGKRVARVYLDQG